MPSDTPLQNSVEAELAWDPSITAGHIGVTARNGAEPAPPEPGAARRLAIEPAGMLGASTIADRFPA